MRILLLVPIVALAIVSLAGCGAHRDTMTRRFVRPAKASTEASEPNIAPKESLAQYMKRVRHLSANARPRPKTTSALTLESRDRELAAALVQARTAPTSGHFRRVAYAYYRLGVRDTAHEYFNRALKLDPRDALAYDGMARLWRDWGLLSLGLSDAHRAAYYAPQSPVVQNTLGTVYQALGQAAEARQAFVRAAALDPSAAYALNNLCNLSLLEGRPAAAVGECESALRVQPTLVAARNNLALAYAASGRIAHAEEEILAASDRATGLYNVGILRMSRQEYSSALDAFHAASDVRPKWRAPRARAAQAERLLAEAAAPARVQ